MGLSDEDTVAVRDWRTHSGFGAAKRAVLAATDEVLRDGAISAPTWAECERHVGGHEVPWLSSAVPDVASLDDGDELGVLADPNIALRSAGGMRVPWRAPDDVLRPPQLSRPVSEPAH